ncbi:short chain dehydrogenase/reductase [Exophiala viscosa]|uniref:Short chain dehydrogenase/reductase n=1 Tax=Exophiala viscosa TaxID=2486360 RepID=A0AAN6DQ33_9EURO|nr:short chain dehydrogenase/reductase [Exophiala viscosa]
MASQSKLHIPSANTIVQNTLLSPFLTGPLLLYVQRNPSILDKIPWFPNLTLTLPFRLPFNIRNSITLRADPPLKTLKVLFGIGLALYVNRWLNRLALNYWHLTKQGEPWDFDGEGKEVIVITGGCSGFGKEMVKMLAAKTRAKIVVLDIQDLPEDMKSIPRLSYHKINLSNYDSIHSTVTELLQTTTPTVLINNAGIAQAHTILNTSDAFLDKIFRINVLSHFSLLRLILPKMLAAKKGHIVTLASMASYTGQPNLGDYSASKAAVLGMHESLVQELAHRYENGHCIQASIVHPIWARTPLVSSWEFELDRSKQFVLTADEVAGRVVVQVLGGRSGSVYVPEKMIQGTFLRCVPDWMALAVRGSINKATKITEAA